MAARTLRAMDQPALSAGGAKLGLGKLELGRVERGELPYTPIRINVLCQVLRVPLEWFTAPVDHLVGWHQERPQAPTVPADDVKRALQDLLRRLEGEDGPAA